MNFRPHSSRLDVAESDRTLHLDGVIDSHTAHLLDEHLQTLDDSADVTLDFDRVEFIDSSGLRVIVAAHTRLADQDRRLRLVRLSEPVLRLLSITGLDEHLGVD